METVIVLMALTGFIMLGAAIVGQPRKFHHRYRFVVEIQGYQSAGFRDMTGLKHNVGLVEHWEGGRMTAYKEGGRSTYDNVTLTRGVTIDQDSYTWMKQVIRAGADAGAATPEYKKDIDVVQLERDGTELRRWTVHQAFPVSFEAGAWDNTVDEVLIESLELAYDYYDQPTDNAPTV